MLLRYSVKRLFETIPTLLIISLVVFGLILVVPGDSVLHMLGYVGDDVQVLQAVDPQVYAHMRARLGLDNPIPVQFLNWLGRTVQGDLGISLNHSVCSSRCRSGSSRPCGKTRGWTILPTAW